MSAINYAKNVKAKILGIVGKDGGYTSQVADVALLIPIVNPNSITPHTESFQSLVWHLMVSHPNLKSIRLNGNQLSNEKAVFLDRDGVLNKSIIKNGKPFPPKNLDELIIPDEVKSGIIKLKKKIHFNNDTNQPVFQG